jgi:hypothetical protein
MATDRQARGRLLTALARAAIAAELGAPWPALPHPAWLDEKAATFVTLTLRGQLRGCIGTLEAQRTLYQDVVHNARAAAFGDPRFPPLAADELPAVHIEVSVLNAPQPLAFTSQADALRRLRPGLDGVILEYGPYRATFLPQVWEQLPEPIEFIAHLKQKAGLPAGFWNEDIRLSTYQAEKFHEEESV